MYFTTFTKKEMSTYVKIKFEVSQNANIYSVATNAGRNFCIK